MIKKWLEKTIIGLDLCPFTRVPYLQGKILIEALNGPEDFLDALNSFQAQTNFETVLMVFPDWKIAFKDFYDFAQDCEDQLETLGLLDEFQLVTFHPNFCFEGLPYEDRANLVNSSPLPLLHLLRTVDLDLLNLSPKEAEALSFGNAKKLERMDAASIAEHFPWRGQLR